MDTKAPHTHTLLATTYMKDANKSLSWYLGLKLASYHMVIFNHTNEFGRLAPIIHEIWEHKKKAYIQLIQSH